MTELRSRALRDLEWFTGCPSLVDSTIAGNPLLFPPPRDWDELPLMEITTGPFKGRISHRVGYYVESLVQMWLENTDGISAVDHGVLIKDGSRTIGELDFLFRRGKQLHHLEVALKYFLFSSEEELLFGDPPSSFPGLNVTDNFEKKRDKLTGSQLPRGRAAYPEVAESHALFKGMICYRPGQQRPLLLPQGMNPAHRCGTWIRSDELDYLIDSRRNWRGMIMEKPFWLSGLHDSIGGPPPGEDTKELLKEIENRFRERTGPVLISLAEPGDGGWREVHRIVVVSTVWPAAK